MTATNAPTPSKPETMYDKLHKHWEKHKYLRGKCKGHAPADPSKRAKNHFRVENYGNLMVVSFEGRHLVTAEYDGNVVLNTSGMLHRYTVVQALNYAMHYYTPYGVSRTAVVNMKIKGKTQPVLRQPGDKWVAYYDGMTLNRDCIVTSPLRPFVGMRVARSRTAEFRRKLKESGFKEMLPILLANSQHKSHTYSEVLSLFTQVAETLGLPEKVRWGTDLTAQAITNAECAFAWQMLVDRSSHETHYVSTPNGFKFEHRRKSPEAMLKELVRISTADMKEEYTTEVYSYTK